MLRSGQTPSPACRSQSRKSRSPAAHQVMSHRHAKQASCIKFGAFRWVHESIRRKQATVLPVKHTLIKLPIKPQDLWSQNIGHKQTGVTNVHPHWIGQIHPPATRNIIAASAASISASSGCAGWRLTIPLLQLLQLLSVPSASFSLLSASADGMANMSAYSGAH